MIMSTLEEFCDAVSIAAAAGTALVGNQMDMRDKRDYGQISPLYSLVITIDTGIVAAGAGTIQFILASDDTAAISPTSSIRHYETPEFVTGTTATGIMAPSALGEALFVAAIPRNFGLHAKRFLGILCRIATQTISAGKINAFLTEDGGNWRAYPAATY